MSSSLFQHVPIASNELPSDELQGVGVLHRGRRESLGAGHGRSGWRRSWLAAARKRDSPTAASACSTASSAARLAVGDVVDRQQEFPAWRAQSPESRARSAGARAARAAAARSRSRTLGHVVSGGDPAEEAAQRLTVETAVAETLEAAVPPRRAGSRPSCEKDGAGGNDAQLVVEHDQGFGEWYRRRCWHRRGGLISSVPPPSSRNIGELMIAVPRAIGRETPVDGAPFLASTSRRNDTWVVTTVWTSSSRSGSVEIARNPESGHP